MKKLSSLIAAVLVGSAILSVAGCSAFKVKLIDEKAYFEALEKNAGISKKDTLVHEKNSTYDGHDVEYVTFTDQDGSSFCYIRYEDADDAMDEFMITYDSLEELLDDGTFEGSNKRMINNDQGYILLDGSVEEGTAFAGMTFFTGDTHYYGGYYVNNNVFIEILTLDGSKSDKEMIDAMLKELGLPTP